MAVMATVRAGGMQVAAPALRCRPARLAHTLATPVSRPWLSFCLCRVAPLALRLAFFEALRPGPFSFFQASLPPFRCLPSACSLAQPLLF